jgi:hypothetical protein
MFLVPNGLKNDQRISFPVGRFSIHWAIFFGLKLPARASVFDLAENKR